MPSRASVQDVISAFLALSKEEQAEVVNALFQHRGNAVYVLSQVIDHFESGELLAQAKLKAFSRKPQKCERGREINRLIKEVGLKKPDGSPDWKTIRNHLDQDGRLSVSPRIKKTGQLVKTKTLHNDWLNYLRSLRQGPPTR